MPRIAFQGTQGGGFVPFPDGTYQLQVDSVEEKMSSKGKPQLLIKCIIMSDDQYNGKKTTLFYSLDPAAGWRLRNLCEAIIPDEFELVETGEKDDNGRAIAACEFDTDDLIGKEFLCDCTTRLFNGENRNNWQNERPLDAGVSAQDAGGDDAGDANEDPAQGGGADDDAGGAEVGQEEQPAAQTQTRANPNTGKGATQAAPAANNKAQGGKPNTAAAPAGNKAAQAAGGNKGGQSAPAGVARPRERMRA
jgi:hypothetical protein